MILRTPRTGRVFRLVKIIRIVCHLFDAHILLRLRLSFAKWGSKPVMFHQDVPKSHYLWCEADFSEQDPEQNFWRRDRWRINYYYSSEKLNTYFIFLIIILMRKVWKLADEIRLLRKTENGSAPQHSSRSFHNFTPPTFAAKIAKFVIQFYFTSPKTFVYPTTWKNTKTNVCNIIKFT